MSYEYYYDITNTNSDSILALLAGLGIGVWIISLAICILIIVSKWIVFKKAGKNGWEAIIPIYNNIVMLEICEIDLWQIVLYIIPIANIYITFKVYIELAKRFGKDTGFGVLTAFFPVIGLSILAFSSAKYEGNTKNNAESSSILDVTESGVPNNSEAKDFSYGYEKEETIVMDPVEDDNKSESTDESSDDKSNKSESTNKPSDNEEKKD